MAKLELKAIKTFRGMDGQGLNADLYLDGHKVAEILDEGCGGELDIDFRIFNLRSDSAEVNRAQSLANERAVQAALAEQKLPIKVERNEFLPAVKTEEFHTYRYATNLRCPHCQGAIKATADPYAPIDDAGMRPYVSYACVSCFQSMMVTDPNSRLEDWIYRQIDEIAHNKRLKRLAKANILYRLPKQKDGEFYALKHKGNPAAAKASVLKKYPDAEFIEVAA